MSGSSGSSLVNNKGTAFARARKWGMIALLLLLVVLVIQAGMMGWWVYRLGASGRHLQKLALDPGTLLTPEGPARLKADLAVVEGALRGLRTQLGFVLKPSWLPWRAGQENLAAADAVMRAGIELARAGQDASQGLQAIVSALLTQGTTAGSSSSEALCEGLLQARPALGNAEQQVACVSQDIAALKAGRLWSPLSRGVYVLQRYLPMGRAALGAAVAAPVLLGAEEPVHYMILAQNNDELRATGGFISGIGLVTLERGKITDLTIKDSYGFDKFTVDHPDAPKPMWQHMGIDLWTTRDGNWSPDFPTAAQDTENLFHLENTLAISGVAAFDMLALQALAEAVGPIELEGYSEPIDGDNVLRLIRESWAPTVPEGMSFDEWMQEGWGTVGEWWGHRKDLMGSLAQSILRRVQEPGQSGQMSALLWAVKRAMDERHIQMYFHDAAAQDLLVAGGWDGALRETPGDYLLALDTNMGYNKVNLHVEKRIDYSVALAQGAAPQATLVITYENHSAPRPDCVFGPSIRASYDEMARDCYWNYLRIYMPSGSRLLSAEGVTETEALADEKGKSVLGTFFMVPAASARTVRFVYSLPDWGMKGYQLAVQKQAGSIAVPVRVCLTWPEGMRMAAVWPRPQAQGTTWLRCDWDLREDRSLSLSLR